MTPRPSFDDVLTDWLDDGPTSAPREDLVAVLQAFPAVRQRRLGERMIRSMPTIARLAMAAALVVLVAGAAALELPHSIGPGVTPRSSVTPSPTPGWAERFGPQTASVFKHPFRYALDPSSRISVVTPPDADTYQFGICDHMNDTGCRMTRVVVRTGGPVRKETCSQSGGELLSGYSPREFANYLEALPGFRVTERQPTAVGGHRAIVLDVDQLPRSDRPCDDIWVWADSELSFTDSGVGGWTRRFLAFDVEGDTVLVIILAQADEMDHWLPTAYAFLDSVHFLTDDATPSQS